MEFPEQSGSKGFDFASAAAAAVANEPVRRAISNAVMRQYTARRERMRELPDSEGLRELASAIRGHVLEHLDYYLEQLQSNVERNGGYVHFAADAAEARRIVLEIARRAGCRRAIKSKSMVSEEIELDAAMEEAGLEVVETDLGEFILQISHDRPSHLCGPVIHKDKASIAKLFSEYFETAYNDDAQALTMQARAHLREKFRRADLGMTGANFLVAQTGQVCVVSNEGNARQSITTPRVLVTLTGIEKVLPRLADLAVMLKLLARSSTGQQMTVYTSLFGGPRGAGETDGPDEFHLVLLDNGRTGILGSEYGDALKCIRCAACLNACPVYRNIGGHAYGHVYSGPIGAVITPLMKGLECYKELPQASTLCGACYEACPVKIDIPGYLVRLRREVVGRELGGKRERLGYRLWAFAMGSAFRYRVFSWLARWMLRRRARGSGWVSRLPGVAGGWSEVRDLPAPAKRSFRKLWKRKRRTAKDGRHG